MTVWRCECVFDNGSFSFPSANDPDRGFPAEGSYVFACEDNPGFSPNDMLLVGLGVLNNVATEIDPPNVYDSRAFFSQYSGFPVGPDPYPTGDLLLGSNSAIQVDDGGGGFTSGGTLSITKDTGTGSVIFSTPLGNYVTTTGLLGIPLTTELRPLSVGIAMQLDRGVNVPLHAVFTGIRQFVGRKDGLVFTGAAGTSVDPGSWAPWTPSTPVHWGGFAGAADLSVYQGGTEETARLSWPGDPFTTPNSNTAAWYRQWTGPDLVATGINACRLPEFDAVLSVWQDTDFSLALRRTQDDGHTWTDRPIRAGVIARSATVQYAAGVITVLFVVGTTIQQVQSRDLGLSWSSPMPVGITGTNPFLVAGRNGELFYFFCASGNIELQRSFNLGTTLFDTSPLVVATGVAPQTFGAAMTPDLVLVVSYISAGSYLAVKSQDFGLTWSPA